MRPRLLHRALLPALGVLAALTLTACDLVSGGADAAPTDANGTTTDELSQDEAILAFYQCLRDNGLDVADPADGAIRANPQSGIDPNDPEHRAVLEQCRDQLPEGVAQGSGQMGQNMASTEALIDFVDCMRENGIDMPDPQPDGRLALPENYDPNSTEFQSATQECSQYLQGGGLIIGSPDGGGVANRGN